MSTFASEGALLKKPIFLIRGPYLWKRLVLESGGRCWVSEQGSGSRTCFEGFVRSLGVVFQPFSGRQITFGGNNRTRCLLIWGQHSACGSFL